VRTINIPNNARIIPNIPFEVDFPQMVEMRTKTWAHNFKIYVYPSLPIKEIQELYCPNNGRPTKNLRTMTNL
jgi:hypothetical protein